MEEQKLTLAVIIPTYRREQVLCQTIEEIFKQSLQPDEIVIVDQTDFHLPETEKYLAKNSEKGLIQWIRHYPPSATTARNRGFQATKSNLILFIDDDILTNPDFLKAHLANYADPTLAAVTGQVRLEEGKVLDELTCRIDFNDPFDAVKMPRHYNKRLEVPGLISGGNFSIRREIFQHLGGFNEYILTLSEDTELAFRLWENGYRVVFDPQAWVLHLMAPSGGCRPNQERTWEAEWRQVVGFPYIAFRYLKNWRGEYFWWLVFLTLRNTVLLKKNLRSPTKLVKAWLACAKAVYQGYKWAKLRDPLTRIK